jgi:hypothetical protein
MKDPVDLWWRFPQLSREDFSLTTKAKLVWFSTWLVILLILLGTLGNAMLRKQYHLANRSVQATGHVTAKTPELHQRIDYSFEVDHKAHSGFGDVSYRGGAAFDELQVGDQVEVFYDPENPSISILGNPGIQLRSGTKLVLFVSLLISTVLTFALYLSKLRLAGR